MKNVLLTLIAVMGFALTAHSQMISKNAIGLRLGDGDGFGTEVSYQRALGENNRLELDLGLRGHKYYRAFRLTGLYQWVWNIDGGFNWYVGAGGGLASVDFDNDFPGEDDPDQTYIYAAGDIGIEYNFEIPLMLSLDFRPEFGFGSEDDLEGFVPDIALGVRYQF